ncbi:MAG: NAD(+)/NADH kinase [Oscillospiraceae bacterium]|jgi:NAD+ kinase|nr:NAD(+)/NADH kinase [Oscillospiraceae bacterium]
MKNLILCPNAQRDEDYVVTKRVEELARDMGISVSVYPMFDDDTYEDRVKKDKEFKDSLISAELVVALGGDGTMLRAARQTLNTGVPILGINMGHKGFLAEVELTQLDLLSDIFRGGFERDERMTLNVELIRDGETAVHDIAINDVVISGAGKVIDIAVFGDGHRITRFEGDGMIIATPTGSTAYSMSAGGPIVDPAVSSILVTPICPHSLISRSIVVSPEAVLTVSSSALDEEVFLTVDGEKGLRLYSGDQLTVSRAENRRAKLIRLKNENFYAALQNKMNKRFY